LRMSFERASRHSLHVESSDVPSKTLDARFQVQKLTVQPATPKRPSLNATASSGSDDAARHEVIPHSYPRVRPRNEVNGHPQPHASATRPTMLRHTFPSKREAWGEGVGRAGITSNDQIPPHPFDGRQTKSDRQDDTAKPPTQYLPLRLDPVHSVLQPQILSVKISQSETDTTEPTPTRQPRPGPGDLLSGSDLPAAPKSRVQELRKVFDYPQGPTMFLPFYQRRARTKSGPSHPITVSTTVAVSTQRTTGSGSTSEESGSAASHRTRGLARVRVPSSSTASPDELAETPSRPPRNRLKKKRESPMKDHISLFESLSQPEIRTSMLSPAGRFKSFDSGAGAKPRRRRVPGWEFNRGSRMLRMLSFGSRNGSGDGTASSTGRKASGNKATARSSLEAMQRNGGVRSNVACPSTRSSILQPRSEQYEPPLFVDGASHEDTERNISPDLSRRATKVVSPGKAGWSSIDLVNSTSETPPTLFHSATTKSGRILPTRKSYGALDPKPEWERGKDMFTSDPFGSGAAGEHGGAFVETEASLPSAAAASGAKRQADARVSPKMRSRYPSSFGRSRGQSLKKAASKPVLNPDLGRPVQTRRPSLSVSWGRRAAAAAFAIGRRLKERRTSRSHSSLSSQDRDGESNDTNAESREEHWNVVVATPSNGLQHPRPARVVNIGSFETFGGESRSRQDATVTRGKL